MKDKEGKGTFGSAMARFLCVQLEATAIYLGHPATQQQKIRLDGVGVGGPSP